MDGENKRSHWKRSISFWIGAAFTSAFYLMVSLPQFRGGSLERYTAHHITEYVTVALFFWAMADLLVKYLLLRPQWLAVFRLAATTTLLGSFPLGDNDTTAMIPSAFSDLRSLAFLPSSVQAINSSRDPEMSLAPLNAARAVTGAV